MSNTTLDGQIQPVYGIHKRNACGKLGAAFHYAFVYTHLRLNSEKNWPKRRFKGPCPGKLKAMERRKNIVKVPVRGGFSRNRGPLHVEDSVIPAVIQ